MTNPAPDPRVDPPLAADETTMLIAWLDYHRETLALKCADLTDEQLRRRSVAPSSLSLLGLVRHMTEVERYWFQTILLGSELPDLYWTEEDEDGDFNQVDTADPVEALRIWRAEIESSDRTIQGLPLETVAKAERRGRHVTLRWILVHLIEEYARHNGHADLLREVVDGRTGQ
ncbi:MULTISPECIES: DinB family protein [unclassified Kitasatospora]|uniref:DinB family protein n=1 Tax=unclassified Kitasatospora TaxID=2633591 RepID=UPI002474537E|nr:DinB family protein [Kitasatospora sp. MAP12-44]